MLLLPISLTIYHRITQQILTQKNKKKTKKNTIKKKRKYIVKIRKTLNGDVSHTKIVFKHQVLAESKFLSFHIYLLNSTHLRQF